MNETQHRFLRAIADRLGSAQVAEVRLFPALRQGHAESGVAVIAVEGLPAPVGDREVPLPVSAAETRDTESSLESATEEMPHGPDERGPDRRFAILTARYRLTIKGPDRGAWNFELVHDADAPLNTIEQVVRGVARRAGEGGEPELLTTAEFTHAVSESWWSPA